MMYNMHRGWCAVMHACYIRKHRVRLKVLDIVCVYSQDVYETRTIWIARGCVIQIPRDWDLPVHIQETSRCGIDTAEIRATNKLHYCSCC